jgi:hypothetical protein
MGGVLADHHGLPGQDEKGLGACAETHLLSHGTKPGPKVRALFVSAQSQFNVAFWPVAPDIAPQCNVGIWGYCGRAVSINDLAQSNGTSRRNQSAFASMRPATIFVRMPNFADSSRFLCFRM